MKKLLCLLACVTLFVACVKDPEKHPNWFGVPEITVSGTTAEFTCRTSLNKEQATAANSGFAYGRIDQKLSDYTFVGVKSVVDRLLMVSVADLEPNTTYAVYAYVDFGSTRGQSTRMGFKTGEKGDNPTPDPDPDPTPDPDPDPDPTPDPSDARYSGWAELPSQISKPGEYYYAYHICPDFKVNGQPARNFSVCYSNDLKSAIWVAAPMHSCYKGSAKRTDAYDDDPKISISQPGKWDGYTRGHMLGSAERTVTTAVNKQVFYYSNIAPQYGQPYFNTGGGAWNTLEGWVDTQWENSADTTYQIIGGYWANKNNIVNGTTIPTHYYKVLLRTKGHKNKWVSSCSREELQCIAIMVEHRTYTKADVPQPSQYEAKGMLFSVKKMEEMTGQRFFVNVPNAPKDSYNTADWGL